MFFYLYYFGLKVIEIWTKANLHWAQVNYDAERRLHYSWLKFTFPQHTLFLQEMQISGVNTTA